MSAQRWDQVGRAYELRYAPGCFGGIETIETRRTYEVDDLPPEVRERKRIFALRYAGSQVADDHVLPLDARVRRAATRLGERFRTSAQFAPEEWDALTRWTQS